MTTSPPAGSPTAGTDAGPDRPDRPASTRPPAPAHTGSRGSRVLGVAALAAVALATLYGLVLSPADVEMQDSVRLMYIHVPTAVFAYVGCFITTVASALWLRKRTPGWDVLAGAGAEIGLVLIVVTLATGSLWGRPTWGTYWTWDARLTSTALLAVMLVGYLALRRLEDDPSSRSARPAVLGLLLVPNVVIVNRSVEWWRSLHQDPTITRLDPQIDGDLLVSLMLGFLATGLVFAWLLIHRFRVGWLEHQAERLDLDAALAARRAEAGAVAGRAGSAEPSGPSGVSGVPA
ncbi:MAG TPA: cytochrome c biogenesis protein CcsA [Acidimicrobiales bacterium]